MVIIKKFNYNVKFYIVVVYIKVRVKIAVKTLALLNKYLFISYEGQIFNKNNNIVSYLYGVY